MSPNMIIRRQCGAGLVAAISLIVVVALMALAITRTVTSGAQNAGLEVLSERALLAANSGAQLGLNRLFAPAGAGSCVNVTFDWSSLASLPNCDAQVTCATSTVRGRNHYTLQSTGRCAAGDLQSERQVLVRALD